MSPIFLNNFERVFNCKSEELEKDAQEEILNGVYSKLMVQAVVN